MKLLIFYLLIPLLAGCASTPKTRPLELGMDVPTQWQAAPAQDTVDSLWWIHLGDDQLPGLIKEALTHNHDLQAAAARLTAAQAQAKIAGAAQWPQVSADGNSQRNRRNFIGFPIPGQTGAVQSTTTSSFGVNFNINWEIDLWGRLRAGQAAALADLQASSADLGGVHLSLAAQTARAYFTAVEAHRQVELAEATLENYTLSTQRIQARYERGLRPSLDLLLAHSNQATAEANLHQRRRQLDGLKRQLELLLGRYPAAAIALNSQLPRLEQPVPAGLPAELISRRPDLIAAERRLAASGARVKEAKAALYPRISLTASGGRSSDQLSDLLDGDFSVWTLLGNITQPIFQGGRLKGAVKNAEAFEQQAVATYTQSVLRAFTEIESALAAEGHLALQEKALQTASQQATAARLQAENRYAQGLTDLITMLTAQRSAFDAESRLLSVQRQHLDNRIDLHLALGGGFTSNSDAALTQDGRSDSAPASAAFLTHQAQAKAEQ
jgi:NodT family efflux transporter outer membrane factor (OMF) lipoprotein